MTQNAFNANKGILEKFEELLNSYFTSGNLPSASYCADS